jgi:hypothetical protein
MNLLAAAATPAQPAPAYNPAYQNQAYQNTTVQPDKPAPKMAFTTKALVVGNLLFNYGVVIIIVVLVYKFVKAFEKISNKIDKGIVIKKDDTAT